ncbi:cyclin-dependent kinase 9-like [Mytilus galloprovincialis]|uniref:cyclin-dependent kinase 9-like n=1 Tax=Mytilus galloprovincialis TaxID=29158 RepID=UPI003F7C0782
MQGKDQKDHHSFSRSSDSTEAASGGAFRRDTSYDDNFNYPYCQDINKYEKLCKIGQGTFGEVFKARDKSNRKTMVAMKKVLMENEKEGFPITALREIKILQLLRHNNVVDLIEICRTKATPYNRNRASFYLIFEFCEHDLAGLLSNANVKFNLGEIKMVMKQLFEGLYYIHESKILHRDMKAANILITKSGVLKLADFGLARAFSYRLPQEKQNRYTNRVVTLWYRPPELLLGARDYGPVIDLWGAGCIMAELWTRTPIMQGKTEQHQLQLITQLCGSISKDVWPNVDRLDLFNEMEMPQGHKRKVRDRLKPYLKDAQAIDLLDKLLSLDPSKRPNADMALNHDFFWTDPDVIDLGKMLSQHSTSMFEYLAPSRRPGQPVPQHRPTRPPNAEHHFEKIY